MLTRDMLAPVHPTSVSAAPRASAAAACKTALEHAEQQVETLTRAQSALASGDYARASRLADDANRRAHDMSGFTAVLRAYAGRLDREGC